MIEYIEVLVRFFSSKTPRILFSLAIFFGAFVPKAFSLELKDGDILLQPLNCWSCQLIEAQERSLYSHIGVYLELSGRPFVLEALGKVKFTPVEDFIARAEKGQTIRVKRFKTIEFGKLELLNSAANFLGLSYDKEFLWDNADEVGEKVYCSELVYKLFYPFYGEELPLKRMSFDVSPKLWERFFHGNPPNGQWGNSPEDFNRSEILETVGEL